MEDYDDDFLWAVDAAERSHMQARYEPSNSNARGTVAGSGGSSSYLHVAERDGIAPPHHGGGGGGGVGGGVAMSPHATTSGNGVTPRTVDLVLVRERMPKRPRHESANDGLVDDPQEGPADRRPPTCDWVFSESHRFPRRDYQYTMVRTALLHNTMVCLPTGLGKTFIAATVMSNFSRWHPKSKIIFMAPTKPLVMQQAEACYNVMGVPYRQISEMNGSTAPSKRQIEWIEKTCFFVTPQVVRNDLNSGLIKPEQIVCLVVDEAHKATCDYAYVSVVRALAAAGSKCRILALTATPAKDSAGVQTVIDNLLISKLEVRSEADIDIMPYIHSKFTEKVVLRPTATMERLTELINDQLRPLLGLMASCGASYSAEPKTVSSSYALRASYENWLRTEQAKGDGAKHPKIGLIYGHFARASYLLSLRFKLVTHGLVPMLQDCELLRSDPNPKVHEKILQNSAAFGQIYALAKKAHEAGELHPKLREVERLLEEHFAHNKDSRVIIFTSLRASVDALIAVISKHPEVRCSRFVGQASSTGDADRGGGGQKQKDQKEVIERFVKGMLNTLVATCVGEEGLDIGECDLIILYDSTGSPLRLVQRVGRTGRKRQGKCVALLMEGFEASQYDRTKAKGASLLKSLMRDRDKFRFYEPPPACKSLVPGQRLAEPTLRDVVLPEISMDEARNRSSLASSSRRKSNSKAAKLNSQDKADFLADRFGLSYQGEDAFYVEDNVGGLLHEDDMFDAILKDTTLEQQHLAYTHHVAHSERTKFLVNMVEFLESFDGTFGEEGLKVDDVMLQISLASPPQSKAKAIRAAPKVKARARAKPLYDDDQHDVEDDLDNPDPDLEIFLGKAPARKGVTKQSGAQTSHGGHGNVNASDDDDNDDDDDDDDDFIQNRQGQQQEEEEYHSQDYHSLMSSIDVLSPVGHREDSLQQEQSTHFPDYVPSSIWFGARSRPAETAAPAESATETPAKRSSVATREAAGDHGNELIVPGTPPPSTRMLRTPASSARQTSRHMTSTAVVSLDGFDLTDLPDRVAGAVLKLAQQPAKALFLPPAPALRERAAQVTLECPVCGCEFPNAVVLGFHCFRQHWPQLDVISYNPSPLDFRVVSSASSSGSAAAVEEPAEAAAAAAAPRPPPLPTTRAVPKFVAPSPIARAPSNVAPSPAAARMVTLHSPSTPSLSFSSEVSPVTVLPKTITHGRPVAISPLQHSSSEFEVEAVLDSKVELGVTKYLIRWAGYSTPDCTWEPEASLIPGAERILREFKQRRSTAAPAKKDQRQLRKAKSPKKRKKQAAASRPRGALKFLDLEAELSGSEELSDDLDEEDEAAASSWVVEDHDDIVYSGTPPSQPADVDVGFYHRVNALQSPENDFLEALASRHRCPQKKQTRTAQPKVSDEDDEVLIIASQQELINKQCAICSAPLASALTVCASCEECAAPSPEPVLLFSSREVGSSVISHLKQDLNVETAIWEIPAHDADFLVGAKLAALCYSTKSLAKNAEKILGGIVSAQQRNHAVVIILEACVDEGTVGTSYERAMAQLLGIPGISLLFSTSSKHTASLLSELHRAASARFPLALPATRVASLRSQIAFLTNAPHVGVARACSLLARFRCMKDIVCASQEELCAVLEISHGQAKDIASFFSSSTRK